MYRSCDLCSVWNIKNLPVSNKPWAFYKTILFVPLQSQSKKLFTRLKQVVYVLQQKRHFQFAERVAVEENSGTYKELFLGGGGGHYGSEQPRSGT